MKPLIACRQVLGVDTYRATNEQAQLVTLAMRSYGHLLKDGTPTVHRFSFDQFADAIEANYSVTALQTTAIVSTLRDVHNLQ